MKSISNYKKILIIVAILLVLYYIVSLLVFHGEFTPKHYYSYEDMNDSKEKKGFVSNDLTIIIEGDSLLKIKDLKSKFYTSKSMYQEFYGFLVHTDNEDKNYRRLKWEEPTELSGDRNWIITKADGKYLGSAFYSGFIDAKIGDTIQLNVVNKKTDYNIGKIKIIIE